MIGFFEVQNRTIDFLLILFEDCKNMNLKWCEKLQFFKIPAFEQSRLVFTKKIAINLF